MLLQTNSYLVPKEHLAEHARLLRHFRQVLTRLGCDRFEVFEQMGNNWAHPEVSGRFVQIMQFRDRRHQREVHTAEQSDPEAQALINDFCKLIDLQHQQQQGLLSVGYYQRVLDVPGVTVEHAGEAFSVAAPSISSLGRRLSEVEAASPAAAAFSIAGGAALQLAPDEPMAPDVHDDELAMPDVLGENETTSDAADAFGSDSTVFPGPAAAQDVEEAQPQIDPPAGPAADLTAEIDALLDDLTQDDEAESEPDEVSAEPLVEAVAEPVGRVQMSEAASELPDSEPPAEFADDQRRSDAFGFELESRNPSDEQPAPIVQADLSQEQLSLEDLFPEQGAAEQGAAEPADAAPVDEPDALPEGRTEEAQHLMANGLPVYLSTDEGEIEVLYETDASGASIPRDG